MKKSKYGEMRKVCEGIYKCKGGLKFYFINDLNDFGNCLEKYMREKNIMGDIEIRYDFIGGVGCVWNGWLRNIKDR